MKRLRRLLACLCAAALVMALALSAAASEESVYQMAVNDRFVDMSAEAMPFSPTECCTRPIPSSTEM